MLKKNHKFNTQMLKYLDLKDKLYSIIDIKTALLNKINKSNNKLNSIKTYILLDNEGYELFFGELPNPIPQVRLSILLSIIETNFIINTKKPECDFYEYMQTPIEVKNLLIY